MKNIILLFAIFFMITGLIPKVVAGTFSQITNEEAKLLKAAETNQSQTAKSLIREGTNITVSNKNGQTPLHFAVKNGDLKLTQLLLAHAHKIGCYYSYIRSKDNKKQNVLHYAIKKGSHQIAKLLLNDLKDYDCIVIPDPPKDDLISYVNSPDNNGQNPMHYAAKIGDDFLISYMEERCRSLNPSGYSVGFFNIFNEKDKSGQTPFDIAQKANSNENMIEELERLKNLGGPINCIIL